MKEPLSVTRFGFNPFRVTYSVSILSALDHCPYFSFLVVLLTFGRPCCVKKQQNITTVLFVVKQPYQCRGKIKQGREGCFLLLSPTFPSPPSPFPFPLTFPTLKDGRSVPVTLKYLILCYIYTEMIIKSADRIRRQTKFFCIDIIMGVI